jgi:hypothetical protein
VIVVLLPGTGPVELTVTTCRSGQPFLLLHGVAGPHPVTGSGELLAADPRQLGASLALFTRSGGPRRRRPYDLTRFAFPLGGGDREYPCARSLSSNTP